MYFLQDKIERTNRMIKFSYGERQAKCTACNGSGYYDDTDSPECSSCDGTGVSTSKSRKAQKQIKQAEELVKKTMTENNGNYKQSAFSLMNLNDNHLFIHGTSRYDQVNNECKLHSNYFYKLYAFVSAFQIIENKRMAEKKQLS